MQNEVHIKIGGDHGGKSFKMSYQVSSTIALFLESRFCYSPKILKIFNRMFTTQTTKFPFFEIGA